ncbi:MAG: hypothetical protein WCH04_09530 [Gammaproteobacteria bacterium]|jgi:hypothetical protein
MDALEDKLNFLSWSTRTVNELRSVLTDLNVPLPAVMAQALAAVVLGAIAWYLLGPARKPKRSLIRLGARAALAAAVIGIVSIVAAWVDNALLPRSHEIIGTVSPVETGPLKIDLLDYRGASVGPEIDIDSQGSFIVRYTPVFADPPKSLHIQANGCKALTQPLTRAHLLGAMLTIQYVCELENG